MIAAMDMRVTKVSKSKINEINFDNLPFGKYFTDHMLEVDYENGEWIHTRSIAYSHGPADMRI